MSLTVGGGRDEAELPSLLEFHSPTGALVLMLWWSWLFFTGHWAS